MFSEKINPIFDAERQSENCPPALLGAPPAAIHANNSLAIALTRAGKYEEAELALESRINSQGENHVETIRVRQNLGGLPFDHMNRRGEAVTQQEHVLTALKQEHGENHSNLTKFGRSEFPGINFEETRRAIAGTMQIPQGLNRSRLTGRIRAKECGNLPFRRFE